MTVEIEFGVLDLLSYPMVHNRLPVLSEIRVVNQGANLDEAELVVEILDDDGPLSQPFRRTVVLPEAEPVVVRDPEVRLDPAAFLQVRDPRPGQVRVSVVAGEEVLGRHEQPVIVLAGNHWQSRPEGLAHELLTSFVLPNDPAVGALLDDAARVLAERTGSPSIEGYQSGEPARVDAIVDAIWTAAQQRRVRYAEPPASWWAVGQKIRSPAEVLSDGAGTCLDTTVVLAAALEQAGLRPVLWMLRNHAFLGYWRTETSLGASRSTETRDVLNAVDLGLMALVETTKVCAGKDEVGLDEAHKIALRHLESEPDAVVAVVDVWECRRLRIFPLPVRRSTDTGVEIVEYRPAVHSSPPVSAPTARATDSGPRAAASPPPRVQQWKNNLLDLTLRNRLINYTDRAGVRIRVPEGRIGRLEDLLLSDRRIQLRPADDVEATEQARGIRSGWELPEERVATLLDDRHTAVTDVPIASYLTRMRGLAYKARTLQEETGANNLYLALGSLRWELDHRELRSPLILVPVRLSTRSRGSTYQLELDESGGSTPNYCLLEKLRQVHGLTVPGLENPVEDEAGIDLEAALHATRVALAEAGIAARVEPTADLSILQFAKFRLWKDLDEHWSTLATNSLVRHLIHTPTEPFEDPVPEPRTDVDLDALDASCPVPADASQLAAVAEATHGRTFVLEGPPGTGKSQTITNLLTRAVADGRRVLFVAEKRAALDVVASRLEAVGMGPFCLDLHDKGSRPSAVRAQLKQAFDHQVAADDVELAARTDDLRASRTTLARYASRLHEPNGLGLSCYSAQTALLTLGTDGPRMTVSDAPGLLGDAAAAEQIRRALRELPDTADPARPRPDHPWAFVSEPLDEGRIAATVEAVAAVDAALALLPREAASEAVLAAARTPADVTAVARLAGASASLDLLDDTRAPGWDSARTALLRDLRGFLAAAHPGLDVATVEALRLPLSDIASEARAAEASGFFGRGGRRKAVLARLQPALRQPTEVRPKEVLGLTTALLTVQQTAAELTGRAHGLAGAEVLPADWDLFQPGSVDQLEQWLGWLGWAGQAVAPGRDGSGFPAALRSWVQRGPRPDVEETAALRDLDEAFRALASAAQLHPQRLEQWCGPVGLLERWIATVSARAAEPAATALRRWSAFLTALSPLRAAGLATAIDDLLRGELPAEDASSAFERGVATASLEERRLATGLVGFEPSAHDRTVHRFTDAAVRVRDELTTAIPAQVVAGRPFSAASGRGRVGELQRELGKQRRALGVRALMERYGDLITQVVPCVLVSPDSVARFFPVGGQTFDLVVFDEASQIRVADAVGAMGRARSVVVVGDSKQMPPTAFAEPRLGPDDDSPNDDLDAVEDEESILTESVMARVPQRWLTWHYRSQDESLIAFSNAHYYDSKLSTFPAPSHAAADRLARGVGVSLVRVEGTFRRTGTGKLLRTNPEEADAIFAEIRRRFAASPDVAPSIGVVTFNAPQRSYIEALVRDSEDERLIEALDGTNGEGLFIKNLENVQGDERDVILFSTAFSVNEKGVLPLNFGPLTRAGGERRLNVAVTRARQQVIVFSSFDPGQIRVEETQSQGMRHLRAYLELAAYGPTALDATTRARPTPDRHRDQIAELLRQRGVIVETGVGLSDFRVDLALAHPSAPDQPLVAVLLDGPGWAARRTVGDRDGLPAHVLGRLMNWPVVERVWLPGWLADPDAVLQRLAAAVGRARDGAVAVAEPEPEVVEATAPVAEEPMRVAIPTVSAAPRRLTGEHPFVPFVPSPRGARYWLDERPNQAPTRQVREVIEEVVAAEGPVHPERLARLVAACFDLTRLSPARIRVINYSVPTSLSRDPDEDFAWPRSLDPATWADFRSALPDQGRPLEHICLTEIGNAMATLCRDAAGMSALELDAETLALFGFRRRVPSATVRLETARAKAVARARLRVEDGRYVV